MSALFEKIIQMSFSAGFIILAICIMRMLFRRRCPRWLICSMWALAAVRLLIPFSIQVENSPVPSAEPIVQLVSAETDGADAPLSEQEYFLWQGSIGANTNANTDSVSGEQDIGQYGSEVSDTADDRSTKEATSGVESSTRHNNLRVLLPYIWLFGVAAVLAYGIVGYVLLYRRSAPFIPAGGKVRESEFIFSPFILGVFRPKIYLPPGLSEPLRSHVLAHENAHLRRKDYMIKPLGFCILALHWFNPLVWIAYFLLSRDIELACDERVIKDMDPDGRRSYANSLLTYSTGNVRVTRRLLNACPVAFGEVNVKKRIKAVVDFKRPAAWAIALALISSVTVGAAFLTDDVANSNAGEEAAPAQAVSLTEKEWLPELTTADFTDENGIVRWPAELLPAGVPDPTSYIDEINLVEKMGDEVHVIFTGKVTVADMDNKDYEDPYGLFLAELSENGFVYYNDFNGTCGMAAKGGYYLEFASFSNHTYSDEYEDYDSDVSRRLKKYADKYLERGEQRYLGDIPVGDAVTIGETVELTVTVRDDISDAFFYNYPQEDTSLGLDTVEFTEWPAELLPEGFPNPYDYADQGIEVVSVRQDDTGLIIEIRGRVRDTWDYYLDVMKKGGFVSWTQNRMTNGMGDYLFIHRGWLDEMYPDGENWGIQNPKTVDTFKFCGFNENVITD